jgi:hypothetical protein
MQKTTADTFTMSEWIDDITASDACIGETSWPMHLKVIDHLDALSKRVLDDPDVCGGQELGAHV